MKGSTADNCILFTIDFENFISDRLDIRELVITTLLIEGFSLRDIQKHQGISYTYVKRIVKGIRLKFKKFRELQCQNV